MSSKIKNTVIALIVMLAFLLCIILSMFDRSTVIGSWQGDGTFDIIGVDVDFEFATELEFKSDGTLVITTDNGTSTYKYSTTDDTITIQGENASWGVYYELKGESLKIKTGRDFSTFTRHPTNKN